MSFLGVYFRKIISVHFFPNDPVPPVIKTTLSMSSFWFTSGYFMALGRHEELVKRTRQWLDHLSVDVDLDRWRREMIRRIEMLHEK